ncbi:MAG: hypothetical protein BMS9Abin05_1537 [Rhodothermia bacterium]|nr:MAG: hypothetical protein BMS9Abin05_1537 [Rhodothermia bacterium]
MAFRISSSDPKIGFKLDSELAVYGIATAIFWFIPLLNRLHVESMAVLAFIAYFVSGRAAFRCFRGSDEAEFGRVMLGRLTRLLLPLLMLTLAILWAPNCDYFRGLLFFPLFPGITVVLSVSVAFALAASGVRYFWHVLIGVLVTIAGPVFDLGFHPQFYTYNHVFGGILGPLYDEELVIRSGLFWFRGLTLLWAGLAYFVGRRVVFPPTPSLSIVALVFVIGAVYLFSANLGLNTPDWYLQQQFSGHRQTEHFDLHYDRSTTNDARVDRWAIEHEYRYARLSARLGTEVKGRVQSYIYPDAETRATLTGARQTSVAPVWLRDPQVHVLASQVGSVFPHELAHVFSREFGLPVIRASLAVGLVEGLAVATEPPDGRPSVHEMVASAEMFRELDADEFAERVAGTLSISGFWLGRGAVSYTISGSFIKFLLDRYGAGALKQAYSTGDFETAYGKSAVELALEWVGFLKSLESINRSAAWRANLAFGELSLFEKTCPHWVPKRVRSLKVALTLLDNGHPLEAFESLTQLITRHPDFSSGWAAWGRAGLAAKDAELVRARLSAKESETLSLSERSVLADALVIAGDPVSARRLYDSVRDEYPVYARETRALITLRSQTADTPDIMRLLVTADSARTKRQRLESILVDREIGTHFVSESGYLWRAQLFAEEENYADALSSLERVMSAPSDLCSEMTFRELGLRCTVWAANYAFGAGDIGAALAYADRAKKEHEGVGDFPMAQVLKDFIQKLTWYVENSSTVGSQFQSVNE